MKKLFTGLLLALLAANTFATNEVKINHNGTDGLVVESDGTLLAEGAATAWDDLRVPMTALKKGKTVPLEKNFPYDDDALEAVRLDWFEHGEIQEMFFVVQMPHAWDEGTDIMPHIHWTPSQDGSVSAATVKWGMDYSWLNLGETHSSYTTISGTSIKPDGTTSITKSTHYLTPLGTIVGDGKQISSMLICRIYRDGEAAADTFTGKAGVLEVDFHYQIDTMGSREEYAK